MTEGAQDRRAGRGRLSTIDLLPDGAEEDIVWALEQLRARAIPQNLILDQFNSRLASRGMAAVSKSAFSRWSVRKAIQFRRLDEVRAITNDLVASLGIAAVTLGVPDVDSPFTSVSVDDGAGIRLAVDHLADLGHTDIAHVAGPSAMLHGRHRAAAFEAAARARGIRARVVETDFSAADGARATTALLDAEVPPTAIVYSNDNMAVAGLGTAQRRGLSVPRDLSITGFDDTELGRHLFPALTSVSTDARGWGAAAARALLQAIAGGEPEALALADPGLQVRDSTAPPTRS